MSKQYVDSDKQGVSAEEASAAYFLPAGNAAWIKPGYKLTEVGVIPVDWEIHPLSRTIERLDAGVSVNSVDESLTSYAYNQSVLKTSAVSEGRFFPDECKKVAPRDLDRVRLRPRADTIIFSRMNTPDLVGECGYVDRDYENLFLPDRLWMTKQRTGIEVSIRWLSYLLSSKPQMTRIKEMATGTSGSMKNLSKEAFLELLIPTPSPPEQRAIAAALSDVEALLDGLERLIAKKRDLKQAAMQQLLSGQTRLPGFSGELDMVCAGEIGRFRGGSGFPIRFQGATTGDYPFFKVSDMNNDGNETLMTNANNYISEGLRKQLGAIAFPANSIVFAKVGAAVFLERKKILAQTSCLDNNMAAFVLDLARVNCRFIHYVFLSIKLGELVSTTALPSLSCSVLNSIKFALPSLEEQTAIAKILSDMDAEIAALEARCDKTRALKQGMMQELLTGRTRLI